MAKRSIASLRKVLAELGHDPNDARGYFAEGWTAARLQAHFRKKKVPMPKKPKKAGKAKTPRGSTSSRTEVRSPTSTRTEVRSPTKTSTEAQGNFTATVTGGAGDGATTVNIRPGKGGSTQKRTRKKRKKPMPKKRHAKRAHPKRHAKRRPKRHARRHAKRHTKKKMPAALLAYFKKKHPKRHHSKTRKHPAKRRKVTRHKRHHAIAKLGL